MTPESTVMPTDAHAQAQTQTQPQETPSFSASNEQQVQTLRDSVEKALNNYFAQLDGQAVTEVYNMVLSEVEAPLLESVMRYTKDNQTKAAIVLGLNRGTLRKKLKQYGML